MKVYTMWDGDSVMPTAPLKVCAVPGCPKLTKQSRCEAHTRAQRVEQTRFHRGGNLYGRRWDKERKRFLGRIENARCACGCGQFSVEVDHIVPHRGDYDLFWDETNWQALAKECHSKKTAREVGFGGKQT